MYPGNTHADIDVFIIYFIGYDKVGMVYRCADAGSEFNGAVLLVNRMFAKDPDSQAYLSALAFAVIEHGQILVSQLHTSRTNCRYRSSWLRTFRKNELCNLIRFTGC